MKRERFKVNLTEDQLLLLGLVLVILLALSMLYCLGFASIALRQTWENAPVPWSDTNPPGESVDQPFAPLIDPTEIVPVPH